MLAELRLLYGLNDDNVGITFGWPLGLVRRAVLDLGTRTGIDAELLFHCSPDELVGAAAIGRGAPAACGDRRRGRPRRSPAMFAGEDAPAPPPPPRVVRDLDALQAELWSAAPAPTEPLCGVGIGDRAYRGQACRIDDETGMADIEPGDVLIAMVTHAGHNSVFPIAGAVATQLGGALSHPAVLARELGLPAVVGVNGLDQVRTGDLVEVDPVAGVVRLLSKGRRASRSSPRVFGVRRQLDPGAPLQPGCAGAVPQLLAEQGPPLAREAGGDVGVQQAQRRLGDGVGDLALARRSGGRWPLT